MVSLRDGCCLSHRNFGSGVVPRLPLDLEREATGLKRLHQEHSHCCGGVHSKAFEQLVHVLLDAIIKPDLN